MPQTPPLPLDSTVARLVQAASTSLGGGQARREAELLLEHVLGVDRAWLFAHPDAPVAMDVRARFLTLLQRRGQGEPMAYILGHAGFWTLDLAVSPATLIPRAETELLVEIALERLPEGVPLRIADLGTGSGAIALALASERPRASVLATDAGFDALAVARANALRHGLANVGFRAGNWFEPLRGECFDLIASNPPYVAEGDPHLFQGDLRFEPDQALSSGSDGLDAIRHLAAHGLAHLVPGGWLLLEHGMAQGPAVRELLGAAGFTQVHTRRDLEGRERVTLGTRAQAASSRVGAEEQAPGRG